jgi:predicted XRE-type DNA-binding protein
MIKIFENLDISDLENEVWKTIEDYPDYQVSNLGRVKSFKRYKEGRILRQNKDSSGYFYIVLCKNRKVKNKSIHILLFEIFNNYKLKSNECIHHINENKEDNYYENLNLMTKKEHRVFHMINGNKDESNPMFGKKHSNKSKEIMRNKRIGKFLSNKTKLKISQKNVGENNSNSKLKEWQVVVIYKITNSPIIKQLKITQKEISNIFNISISTVSRIKSGKGWSLIEGDIHC